MSTDGKNAGGLIARCDREYAAAINDDGTINPALSFSYKISWCRRAVKPLVHVITRRAIDNIRTLDRAYDDDTRRRVQGQEGYQEYVGSLERLLKISQKHFPRVHARLLEIGATHFDFHMHYQDLYAHDREKLAPPPGYFIDCGSSVRTNMSYGGLMRDADSTAVQISSIFVPRIKGAERIDSEDSGGDDSAHYASTDSGSGSVGYPKEYEIWVCPPVASDDIYPLYDCDDFSVHTGPGECPNCGKALRPIKASDIEFSLATQELLA